MIDWLNFWMFLLFIVIGIALLKKLNNDLKFSCLVFQFVACVSFVVAAFSVVPSWNVSFDSALHECTEWKCPDWDGSIGKLNYGEAGNPVCKYEWANGEGERSFVGKTNNTITCISFREKTIEELDADFCKENPTDATRCYCVENVKMFEACNEYGCMTGETEAWDWKGSSINNEPLKTLTKNYTGKCVSSVPMSKKLYCEENPTDTIKCSCLNYEVLAKDVCQESENYKEDVDCRLNFGYVFTYGNTHFAGKVINASEATWYDEIPYYSWDVSNSDGSGFGAKQPLECIRAVPKVGE